MRCRNRSMDESRVVTARSVSLLTLHESNSETMWKILSKASAWALLVAKKYCGSDSRCCVDMQSLTWMGFSCWLNPLVALLQTLCFDPQWLQLNSQLLIMPRWAEPRRHMVVVVFVHLSVCVRYSAARFSPQRKKLSNESCNATTARHSTTAKLARFFL